LKEKFGTNPPLRKDKQMQMHKTTFRQILTTTREAAAISAWDRAQYASTLRHAAVARGNRRAARRLAEIKHEAIRIAALVFPEQVKITLDTDYQVGLLSIRFNGHGRLHLPADSTFCIQK
jgi:hypothetical protein